MYDISNSFYRALLSHFCLVQTFWYNISSLLCVIVLQLYRQRGRSGRYDCNMWFSRLNSCSSTTFHWVLACHYYSSWVADINVEPLRAAHAPLLEQNPDHAGEQYTSLPSTVDLKRLSLTLQSVVAHTVVVSSTLIGHWRGRQLSFCHPRPRRVGQAKSFLDALGICAVRPSCLPVIDRNVIFLVFEQFSSRLYGQPGHWYDEFSDTRSTVHSLVRSDTFAANLITWL